MPSPCKSKPTGLPSSSAHSKRFQLPTSSQLLSRRKAGRTTTAADAADNLHQELLRLALDDAPQEDTIGWSQPSTTVGPLHVMSPSRPSPLLLPPPSPAQLFVPSPETSDDPVKAPLVSLKEIKMHVDKLRDRCNSSRIHPPLAPTKREDLFPLENELNEFYSLAQKVQGIRTQGCEEALTLKGMVAASIEGEQETLLGSKRAWLSACKVLQEPYVLYDVNEELYVPGPISRIHPLIAMSMLLVLVLHLLSHLATRSCTMALKFQRIFLRASFALSYPQGIPDSICCTLETFPTTVKTLRRWFPVSSDYTVYAVCPSCSRLYAPKNGTYPVMCTWDEFEVQKNHRKHLLQALEEERLKRDKMDGTTGQEKKNCQGKGKNKSIHHDDTNSNTLRRGGTHRQGDRKRKRKSRLDTLEHTPCNTILVKDPAQPSQPICRFKHRSFKEWLSKLLSRPGMHKSMDAAWTRNDNIDGLLRDIWNGSTLRNFRGPDGNLFSQPQEDKTYIQDGQTKIQEGRSNFVFSLNVDWFNPYGNKQSGVRRSVGIISLVCLNLPEAERYCQENMYLAGVIPGPNEPSPEQLNHFIQPVVDEFLPFWEPGVRFSKTADYPNGRVIHVAIIPVVADLPASRKVHGSAGTTATRFCALCLCKRKTAHGFDPEKWPKRSQAKWLKRAHEWKDAVGVAHRKKIFNKFGVRWTPLLDLPYWDPSEFVVVDTMHNLFLGLFKNHCLSILGMDITLGTETEPDPPTEKELSQVQRLLEAHNPNTELLRKRLGKFRKPVLQEICRITGGIPRKTSGASTNGPKTRRVQITKSDIIAAILEDFPSEVEQLDIPRKLFPKKKTQTVIFGKKEIEEIRTDISRLVLPSWVSKPPPDFGSPSRGKLKADVWRTICTICLPITLIRCWGDSDRCSTEEERRQLLILDNFMDLVQAVLVATPRAVSKEHAETCLSLMKRYQEGVLELFPGKHKDKPNLHAALHLHDLLLKFGPVHAWWTYPFERIIGKLQQVNTNQKIGELENTMMDTLALGGNLRMLFKSLNFPQAFKAYEHLVSECFDYDVRGTLHNDLAWFKSHDLQEDTAITEDQCSPKTARDQLFVKPVYEALQTFCAREKVHLPFALSPSGMHLRDLQHGGIRYTPNRMVSKNSNMNLASELSKPSSLKGDSQVMISSTHNQCPVPAIIRDIIQIDLPGRGMQTYLAVQRRVPASNSADLLLKYPIFRASIWEDRFGGLEIVPVSFMQGPYASCFIGNGKSVVVSLDRSGENMFN